MSLVRVADASPRKPTYSIWFTDTQKSERGARTDSLSARRDPSLSGHHETPKAAVDNGLHQVALFVAQSYFKSCRNPIFDRALRLVD